MEKAKLKLLSVLPLVFSSILSSCGKPKQEEMIIDYPEVTTFEESVNNGDDVIGKVVTITVDKIVLTTAFGYNIQTGEHLNFVSEKHPGVKVGDVITVKITDIIAMFGSYLFKYEILKVN